MHQQAVGQGTFPMVDVCDNTEVANVIHRNPAALQSANIVISPDIGGFKKSGKHLQVRTFY
jgi:hypothetical protein